MSEITETVVGECTECGGPLVKRVTKIGKGYGSDGFSRIKRAIYCRKGCIDRTMTPEDIERYGA
ncbi:hypothetical protein AXK56_09240 [Tsukamurella pulmonis]|uniref:Uncharacterized protein n=1 Tax=Tsukamurella pulmonis TaxID=47312 RepID=A0A1H1BLW4_9ACTN|nr:hypothetical protein [Tsukamurella pulmonis]KXO90281.1 hypothetical protein AXK56_09240 [Tsukamurella pulmonis]SDQ53015.1 hypothetical protein SAMN04489765_0762 [Tsukamurella pulmonis]SUP24895.1 Uncharacterised protein [Tsukamurella pulmonis]